MSHHSLLSTWPKGAPASSGTGFRHDLEDGLVHAHCIRARPVNLVGPWASSPRPIAWMHACWPGWQRYCDHPCSLCWCQLRALRAIVGRRQAVAMCAQEKSRLDGAPTDMQPCIRVHLEWLQVELKTLDREFHDRVQDHAAWQIPGRAAGTGPSKRARDRRAGRCGPLNRYRYRYQHRVWGGPPYAPSSTWPP